MLLKAAGGGVTLRNGTSTTGYLAMSGSTRPHTCILLGYSPCWIKTVKNALGPAFDPLLYQDWFLAAKALDRKGIACCVIGLEILGSHEGEQLLQRFQEGDPPPIVYTSSPDDAIAWTVAKFGGRMVRFSPEATTRNRYHDAALEAVVAELLPA